MCENSVNSQCERYASISDFTNVVQAMADEVSGCRHLPVHWEGKKGREKLLKQLVVLVL